MEYGVAQMFPISVPIFNVIEDTDELKTYAASRTFFDGGQTSGELDNGRQSKNLRVLNDYPKINQVILKYFSVFCKEVFEYEHDFMITTSWLTVTKQGQSSGFHNHKNSFWSGVYYYDEYDELVGDIQFYNPLRTFDNFELIPKKKTLANAIAIEIKPTNKSLIFFPSFLAHRVTTHYSKRPRHSIAFNIIPINHYGNDDSTYDTNWIINNQKV